MNDSIEFDSNLGFVCSMVKHLKTLGVRLTQTSDDEDRSDLIVLSKDPDGYFRDAEPDDVTKDGRTYVFRRVNASGGITMMLMLSEREDSVYRNMWGLEPRKGWE